MQILVVGAHALKAEIQEKFGESHQYVFIDDYTHLEANLNLASIVFDFLLADNPQKLASYQTYPELVIFYHAVTLAINQLLFSTHVKIINNIIFGFNGWPTQINRQYLEVSALKDSQKYNLTAICEQLGTAYLIVDDRVGLVTPRILSMIINEAFYTLQEGTATIPDIDLAMKLGTNYPLGPFEWAEKIGLKNIFGVLEAVYHDTHDERYKICPFLKKEYLREILKLS